MVQLDMSDVLLPLEIGPKLKISLDFSPFLPCISVFLEISPSQKSVAKVTVIFTVGAGLWGCVWTDAGRRARYGAVQCVAPCPLSYSLLLV